jgi:hypothetical protein
MLDKKRSINRSVTAGISSLLILGVAGFLFFNQQYVADQITVWSYQPSENVQNIEKRVDFTQKGQFYFYATRPQVDGSDQFNADCPRQEARSPILGCYAAGRIFIYSVSNQKLDGIEEVTAAHEMLHSAWDRMTLGEKDKIGKLLRKEYQNRTDDTELQERMDYYSRTEPGEFENELHSILGTEEGTLGPELDSYYARYFEDRQKIVALHRQYDSVFHDLKSQSDALYQDLKVVASSIAVRTEQYNQDIRQLSSDIAVFNTKAESNGFSSASDFNRERSRLLARSNQTDVTRESISADIQTYNDKYAQYQAVSSEIDSLNESIDSIKDLQPSPSV